MRDLNNFEIVCIPDYLVKTLKSNNITLDDLDSKCNTSEDNIVYYENLLLNTISLRDLMDLISSNTFFDNIIINKMSIYFSQPLHRLLDKLHYSNAMPSLKDSLNSFISLFSNNNTIIMSEYNKLYEYYVTQNTLFIIVHEGFTNFTLYSDADFKNFFIDELLVKLISTYGEKRVYANETFKQFFNFLK